MTQMGLLWWAKQTSATNCGAESGGPTSTPTTPTTPATSRRHNSCFCLMKLVKKLKKHSRLSCGNRSDNTFHCKYDPWSYALNFDTSGCGSMLDDDNYHHLLAFSSRFAATPPNAPPRLLAVASSH